MKTILFLLATALTVSAQTRPVVLTWKAPSGLSAVSYTISRGVVAADGSVASFAALTPAPIPDLSYTDLTALSGTTYAYQIQTVVPPCVLPVVISTVCGVGNAKTPPAATLVVIVPLLPLPPVGLAAAIP